MKIVARVLDENLILSPEDFEIIAAVVRRSERMDEEHVGKGKGTTGYDKSYIPKVSEPKTDTLRADILDDATYDAYKALTKMRETVEQ